MNPSSQKRPRLAVWLLALVGLALLGEGALNFRHRGLLWASGVSCFFTANMLWTGQNFGRYLAAILFGFFLIRAVFSIHAAAVQTEGQELLSAGITEAMANHLGVGFGVLYCAIGLLILVNLNRPEVRHYFDSQP